MTVLDQVSTYNTAFNATSLGTTFATNPTAGTTIFVAVSMFNATPTTVTGVTDNAAGGSNTYTLVSGSGVQDTTSGDNSVMWWVASSIRLPSSGSLVVTETSSPVSNYPGIQAFSVNGSLDAVATAAAAGPTTVTTPSVTSTVSGDLFLAALTCSGTSGSVTSSWTSEGFDSGNPAFLVTYALTTAPGAGAQAFSATIPSGNTAAVSLLAIKPAGGGTITGSGGATAPVVTASGSGTYVTNPAGSGGATAPVTKASGTGTYVTNPAGSGGATAPVVKVSGTGTETAPTYSGSGGATAPAITVSGTGTETPPTYSGSGGATAPVVIASGTGTFTGPGMSGSGAVVAPAVKAAGTGTFVSNPAGTGAVVAPVVTASGTGSETPPTYSGSGAVTLPSVTVSGTGTETGPGMSGAGALVVPTAKAAGTGSFIPVFAGTGALLAPQTAATGSGTVSAPVYTGSGSVVSPKATASGAGTFAPAGTIVGTGAATFEITASGFAGFQQAMDDQLLFLWLERHSHFGRCW